MAGAWYRTQIDGARALQAAAGPMVLPGDEAFWIDDEALSGVQHRAQRVSLAVVTGGETEPTPPSPPSLPLPLPMAETAIEGAWSFRGVGPFVLTGGDILYTGVASMAARLVAEVTAEPTDPEQTVARVAVRMRQGAVKLAEEIRDLAAPWVFQLAADAVLLPGALLGLRVATLTIPTSLNVISARLRVLEST